MTQNRYKATDLTTQELRDAASDLVLDAYDGDWPPAKPQEPMRSPRTPDARAAPQPKAGEADLRAAARKALNYIENTEAELGIKLDSAEALRAALEQEAGR